MTLEVAGILSATMRRMIAKDRRAVTPRETFSVFSPVEDCGMKNPTMVTTVMNALGMIKLRM